MVDYNDKTRVLKENSIERFDIVGFLVHDKQSLEDEEIGWILLFKIPN